MSFRERSSSLDSLIDKFGGGDIDPEVEITLRSKFNKHPFCIAASLLGLILALMSLLILFANNKLEKECLDDVIYIPTREGLVEQFVEIQDYWYTVKRTRALSTVLHQSAHFEDVNFYNLCEIFDLKNNIKCRNITSEQMIRKLGKNVCCKSPTLSSSWLSSPSAHGITYGTYSLVDIDGIEWNRNEELCILGG
jgi:hypothetical protein